MIRLAAYGLILIGLAGVSLSVVLGSPSSNEKKKELPWASQNSGVREVPWINRSAERAERRENFFKRLPFQTDSNTLARSEGVPSLSAPNAPVESSSTMEDLPWKNYRSEWQDSVESVFLWPIRGASISSGYGIRRGRMHEGLDLKGKPGQPILATASGKVVFDGSIRGYGKTVVIYHGKGLSSVYAHNRENLVSRGDIVEQGQAIATVGQTGHSTGYHLHFEIRREGKPENPLRYHFKRDMNPSLSQLN